ncbi:hypothetical protein NGM10_16640 (plasmid) [Halorussus salilacus]|uniref:hypothetical protein n=1 Tax=Halorussus salilacus TaxID=2953750 RepID=UPI00209FAD8A|nr:hypothetical protein [Halorussus salilacus]USZ69726.1 hypothetical protein NGM10_16640 [Halorussus salilacus]
MDLYERIADLPVSVESVEFERRERETTKFTRATTVVSLRGDGETGVGEDVTYDADLHPIPDRDFGLDGEYAFGEFSRELADREFFPDADPDDHFRHYRRWAFESAALDLALRQADTDLGAELGREYDPVRFVASPPLGDPPSAAALDRFRERTPDVEFKLDADDGWTPDLVADLADAGVRVVDFKAHYEDSEVAGSADPDLYRRVVEAFPDAVLEDPAWTDGTRDALADARERVSWDYPITGVESVRDLPFEPEWLNVKPSRFGSVESLFETVEYCEQRGVRMYGGGQFELDAGRRQIQLLASLFYPDAPNDVAPGAYNDPDPSADLPPSPLSISDVRGFR